ncbi:DUF350 domain-containing protein [Gordonia hongkongensis]|jgi:uncharacterized membrane protein YjfL (UPF0719 family)|uniref:DUF350 domain-containing protein n=1 Tax=Gordonia hongkongensis TaxID=1701090 RepID=A0AAX3T938_9ACTN|nr:MULTISPECIES: DUF350 domain-containing protein [Gordonia]QIK49548.1 DUF350 domain-containing protein [Gordonia terrae]KSU58887.1 hypothetical protein AS181_09435 [Gordonia sp. SGD-V-85]MBR7192456.1 DUF350 domain-containing protein [Gordonia sp. SCSIO 19800]MCX2755824.1 DUF350 domain-containing protein [Gordonia sp. 4N]OCH81949.1 hypothetical protein A9310_16025 [Gordonia sp. UCD-TK1]
MLADIAENAYAAGAYAGVGVILMIISFGILDLLTPGKLRSQLWTDRNRNAGILVGSNMLAVAVIVTAAIVASEGRLLEGLTYTAVYSAIGLVVMAVTFLVIDLLTPGNLGELLVHPESHPAVWVQGVAHIGVSIIVAASIL